MSTDQELQAKIAALSGRINRHKQQAESSRNSHFTPYPTSRGRGYHVFTPHASHRHRPGPVHRNRSLVLNTANNSSSPDVAQQSGASSVPRSSTSSPGLTEENTSNTSGVSKRDRHMQWINTSVYDQISQQRAKDIQESLEQKRWDKSLREKARLQEFFRSAQPQSHPGPAPNGGAQMPQQHLISIAGIPFIVVNGGSKLIRAPSEWNLQEVMQEIRILHIIDDPDPARPTPKQANLHGVFFHRSKNGNLYRAGLVKPKKQRAVTKIQKPCPRFTATGTCEKGPRCRYIHNVHKIAVCKDYLLKGSCPAGDACDLSHDLTPERVPHCVYFSRSKCTNEQCRYPHIRVNAGAPVCRNFAKLGYCEKGANCYERHAFECPDYANTGTCTNEKCRLPHIDRAGQLRKTTNSARTSSPSSGDDIPDISSDEGDDDEIDSDNDVDSDLEEDIFMQGTDNHDHDLTQQEDYIRV